MRDLVMPKEVEDALLIYKDRVIEKFDAYEQGFVNRTPELTDPFNSDYPGVSEDWILNWDKTKETWNNKTLKVHACGRFYSLVRPGKSVQDKMKEWLESVFEGYILETVSGHFYYPGNGGYMGWHTNSDMTGIRAYIVYAEDDNSSFFRYYDQATGKVVTDWDRKGWNLRYFNCVNDPNELYWHCVYAKKPRISIGTRLNKPS